MTPAEKLLWQEIRANKLGVRFRRQQVIQGFIVDFYCHQAGLVVEEDGDIHELQQRLVLSMAQLERTIPRGRHLDSPGAVQGVFTTVSSKIV